MRKNTQYAPTPSEKIEIENRIRALYSLPDHEKIKRSTVMHLPNEEIVGQKKDRNCLKCNKRFTSLNFGHRICTSCRYDQPRSKA